MKKNVFLLLLLAAVCLTGIYFTNRVQDNSEPALEAATEKNGEQEEVRLPEWKPALETAAEKTGIKAADLAVVREDAGQEPEETVQEEPVQESIAEAESEPEAESESEAEPDGMEETESEPETESGPEDYTFYSTYEGFLIQDEEALEKCMDDLQNHYPSGRVTLRIANEMADLDTSALAEMIWERDLETEWEVVPEEVVFWEGKRDKVVPAEGTEYAVRVCFENSYYRDNWEEPLLYRPEVSGPVPDCMQPFLSEEVRAAISEADIGKDEYLGLFVKQDVGGFHYFTYGFSKSDRNDVGSCSHVLLWVSGERADGTHVNQVLEVPTDNMGYYVDWNILWLRGEDLNRDGEEDLLITTGCIGFLWNGKSGQYELFKSLPDYITLWMKDGTIYSRGRSGCSAESCTKYELIDGIYQETQYVICEHIRYDIIDGESVSVLEIREYRNGKLVFSKETSDWDEKDHLYPEMPWMKG